MRPDSHARRPFLDTQFPHSMIPQATTPTWLGHLVRIHVIKPAFVRISCRAAVSGSAGRADVHDRSTHCPVDVKLTVRGFFRLNGARPRETALDGASVIETTWHCRVCSHDQAGALNVTEDSSPTTGPRGWFRACEVNSYSPS